MNRRTLLAALGAMGTLPALTLARRAVDSGPRLVTLSGAGPQGRWFQETALFGKVLSERIPGLTVNGVIGKGVSAGNIRRIAAGKAEGGRFYVYDLENAHTGRQGFADGFAYDDVLVWMKLATNLFRVVAVADIERFSDLRGRSVAVGVRGSGDDMLATRVLAGYGVTPDNARFQYVGRTDGQAALANGQVDAVAYAYTRNNQGHLGPVFAARTIGADVDFVAPDDDRTQAFLAADPTFFLDTYGEPVFGRPELRGIAYHTGMAIHRRLDEELVHRMTRTLYDNWQEVIDGAPWFDAPGEASLETAAAITTLPYHPGARRYYEEREVWENHRRG